LYKEEEGDHDREINEVFVFEIFHLDKSSNQSSDVLLDEHPIVCIFKVSNVV